MPNPLPASEILACFIEKIPQTRTHMFCFFSERAAQGDVRPFVRALVDALGVLDTGETGLAAKFIERMAAITGIGEEPFEALIQVLAEVYVACGGASVVAATPGSGNFVHEPGPPGQKNPEFEACASGKWYAVEAKTPKLIDFSRRRASTEFQLTARLPKGAKLGEPLLPRDNPIKDFLVSAEGKFQVYAKHRPAANRVLTIIWDDFVQEPVAALLNPNSGLLTSKSFYRDSAGNPVRFPHVDAVLLCRHQHQLIRATREEPLLDGQATFVYHGVPFPPKALVANPAGRPLEAEVLAALDATPIETLPWAEYQASDLIMWL